MASGYVLDASCGSDGEALLPGARIGRPGDRKLVARWARQAAIAVEVVR